MGENDVCAVARIRVLEKSLFSGEVIRQLMACPSYEQCLSFLEEKGWGGESAGTDADWILSEEEKKTWKTVGELGVPMEKFEVLRCPRQFHNLKAAIREVYTGKEESNVFYEDPLFSGEHMREILMEKEYQKLPVYMRDAARDALVTLLHTGDGQSADVIVDKAALERMQYLGLNAKDSVIRDYAETVVALSDIKIAVRAQKTGKSLEFMERAMAECASVNVRMLSKAALGGMEDIADYLRRTSYAAGADALMNSPSDLEKWCDDRIIQVLQSQKYQTFGIGPIVAYVIARQNEIKTVRIILTGKRNDVSDAVIQERIREMYV